MARPSSSTSRVMVCRFLTLALPPRSPKDTNPSWHGQISRVMPTFAPERLPRILVRGKRPTCPIDAIITASWADTSTTWGRPEASALNAATTASGPTWAQAVGSVHRTGARSGSPVQYMFPVDAITPRSLALHAARGPSDPNGVTRTHTAPGAAAGSRSSAPGQPGVPSTTSAPARSSATRGSSGPLDSMQVFPALQAAKRSEVPSGPSGGTTRRGSPPGGSTFTTSAPRSARIRPVMAAGSPATSTTRTPASNASGTAPSPGTARISPGARRRRVRGRGRRRPIPVR